MGDLETKSAIRFRVDFFLINGAAILSFDEVLLFKPEVFGLAETTASSSVKESSMIITSSADGGSADDCFFVVLLTVDLDDLSEADEDDFLMVLVGTSVSASESGGGIAGAAISFSVKSTFDFVFTVFANEALEVFLLIFLVTTGGSISSSASSWSF
jgi:hypothetical protein